MQFWKIDSWDYERATISVDDLSVWSDNLNYWGGYWAPLCGQAPQSWNEQTLDVDVSFPHSDDTAMVKVYTTLNQAANDESWGVRQLNIFLALCPDNCSTCTAKSPTACLSNSQSHPLIFRLFWNLRPQ
jgi:hypothetical protein